MTRLRDIIKRIYYNAAQPLLPPVLDEILQMTRTLGYVPNVWRPRTFNEKIAHRKLFTQDARYARLSDKLLVRDYVSEKIGEHYLAELYDHVSLVEDLDLESLPRSFVVKGRHNWGTTMLIDNKYEHDWDVLRDQFEVALQTAFNRTLYEYWYDDIPPGLIVEERLRDDNYFVPLDIKLLVFHGEVKLIQVFHDRMGALHQRHYTPTWEPLVVGRSGSRMAKPIEKPKQLDELIRTAETLGKGFDFVRVDLYAPNDERVVFGEMTFAPASGRSPFVPTSFDWELGSYW